MPQSFAVLAKIQPHDCFRMKVPQNAASLVNFQVQKADVEYFARALAPCLVENLNEV